MYTHTQTEYNTGPQSKIIRKSDFKASPCPEMTHDQIAQVSKRNGRDGAFASFCTQKPRGSDRPAGNWMSYYQSK